MKYALFTGATGGLGQQCVRLMAESGRWTVFAAGTHEGRLAKLAGLPNVIPIRIDITQQASVEAARQRIGQDCPLLDAVINFAGVTAFGSAVEGDPAGQAERLLQINVLGMIRVNRAFFDMIRRPGGRIINCSSEAGWMTAQPFATSYVLSKRAVEGYSDSLRRELMFLGIDVIKIQPGNFQTALTDQVYQGYQQVLADTQHFRELLTRLEPLMLQELRQHPDPARLVRVVLRALETKRPRISYRVATGRLLLLLELLPEKCVDRVYRLAFRISRLLQR